MNQLLPIETEILPSMPPCMVLCKLQEDLAEVAKLKELPFNQTYFFAPGVSIELSMQKTADAEFTLTIDSINGTFIAREVNFKKFMELVQLHTTRVVSLCLGRINLEPCSDMGHLGADEILALHSCINQLRANTEVPFSYAAKGPRGVYQLFAAAQNGGNWQISFETNYIYGNAMKWRVEFEFVNQAIERADKIINDSLKEWLRPNGSASRPSSKGRPKAVAVAPATA